MLSPLTCRSALGLVGLAASLLIGCGDDAGFKGHGKHNDSDAKPIDGSPSPSPSPGASESPTPTPAAEALNSLTWFWLCDEAPSEPPKASSDKDPVIAGAGPHKFKPSDLHGTPVHFAGRLCQPASMPRDILFVIDTSGSMYDNDRRVGNTCGRLQAVQSVIQSLPAGSAQFGVVTFGSTAGRSSSALFAAPDQLYADLAGPSGTLADVLCAAKGGTNYQDALVRTSQILQGGRANATKEIYFISDGDPDSGDEGIAEATALKTVGINIGGNFITATIATVMLAGKDRVLETQIASRDKSGKALHAYAAQTTDLTRILTDFSANSIVGGDAKYRPIGGSNWTTLTLLDHVQGFDFNLPSFNIERDAAPNGIEVVIEYYDRHDHRYATGGKLLWQDGEDSAH